MALPKPIIQRVVRVPSLLLLVGLIASTAFAAGKPLKAPAKLTTQGLSDTEVLLTWKLTGDNPAGFEIRRATTTIGLRSDASIIAYVTGDVRSLVDEALSATNRYYYAVRAFDGNTPAHFSSMKRKKATTLLLPPDVAAPSGLSATALSAGEIRLSWHDNAPDEAGYAVERAAVPSGPWEEISRLAANTTSFVDRGLLAGSMYRYRVRAY